MPDRGAVEALKASFRGVVAAGAALEMLGARVEALVEQQDVDPALLDDLARLSAAVALAAAALRGLSEAQARRADGDGS